MLGWGVFTYPEGHTYSGKFENNEWNGPGRYVKNDKTVVDAMFEHNKSTTKPAKYNEFSAHVWGRGAIWSLNIF